MSLTWSVDGGLGRNIIQNMVIPYISMTPATIFPVTASSRCDYRQVSNISRTKSQHLKDSRTVLRLSLPNPLKPDVKSRMKM